ncbi:MAG: hypothetical protein A2341_22350 [Deltaproteobacteria bacterium RIFOXYB12_FULL_58_9]|nr:MAG: hypothetical protein A2341_22350 [Deltaproteobacteria bacterium RIFOXYB12_FULL_58_9]
MFIMEDYDRWKNQLFGALLFVQGVSGLQTWRGAWELSDRVDWFSGKLMPPMLTAVAVLFAVLLWKHLYEEWPQCRPADRKRFTWVFVLLVPGVALTSSFFGLMGQAATVAIEKDMTEIARVIAEDFGSAFRWRRQIEEQALALGQNSTTFDQFARQELKTGAFSGSRANGAVHTQMKQNANGFGAGAKVITDQRRETDALQGEADAFQAELNAIVADKTKTTAQRSLEVTNLLLEANPLLSQLSRTRIDVVRGILGTISMQQSIAPLSDSDELATRQDQVRGQIASMAAEVSLRIGKELTKLEKANKFKPTYYRVLGPFEAIIAHFDVAAPFCLLILAIDLLIPLAGLSILSFLYDKRRRGNKSADDNDSDNRPSATAERLAANLRAVKVQPTPRGN